MDAREIGWLHHIDQLDAAKNHIETVYKGLLAQERAEVARLRAEVERLQKLLNDGEADAST